MLAPPFAKTAGQRLLDEKYELIEDNLKLLATSEGRRELTKYDPLLFALIYMPESLMGKDGPNEGLITLGEFHIDMFEQAELWAVANGEDQAERDAYVAPRETGKSTLVFKVFPVWASAHGHCRFIAAFADAGSQATIHLANFRRVLRTNRKLKLDYPDLTNAGDSDTKNLYISKSGFTFFAKGADAASLGLNVDSWRPDLIILDDIEPGAGKNTLHEKDSRLRTVRNDIFYLATKARVVISGTVTMPDSIIHDLVKSTIDGQDVPEWVSEEKIRVHHYQALITDELTGEQRSMWPERWSLEELQAQAHMREFRMQMQNDPMGYDGDYWNSGDFTYGEIPAGQLTGHMLSIDPAVTSKEKSDYTALAVISYSKPLQRCVVRHARRVKVQPGQQLRQVVAGILYTFPEIAGILVETNQGGDVWRNILQGLLPAHRIKTVHNRILKEERAAKLLNHYQRGRVWHEVPLETLEQEMVAFPKAAHDDLVDAVGNGIETFFKPTTRVSKASMSSHSYV